MEMAAAVRKCATFIEKKIGKHIDVTTMAYNRLMNISATWYQEPRPEKN